MKKFLALCIVMSLIFVFAVPVLATDVNKIDLKSNLSFTFEPSSSTEKSLTVIPFPDVDLTQIQNESSDEIKKAKDFILVAFGFGLWLAGIIALSLS